MDPDIRDQFHALREDNRRLRDELRADIARLAAKLDGHVAAVNARCALRGEQIAVLQNHDRERERRVDRRIALGMFLLTALSVLLRILL